MDATNATSAAQPEQTAGFEALLWDLFLRLMDVPGHMVEAELLDAQRRLCRALELDRSTLWQAAPDDAGSLRITHMYDAAHDPLPSVSVDGSVMGGSASEFLAAGDSIPKHARAPDYFPWVTRRILAGETVAIAALDDLPAEAAADLAALRRFGTHSTVAVPLSAHGTVFG